MPSPFPRGRVRPGCQASGVPRADGYGRAGTMRRATRLLRGAAPAWASAANPPPIRYALAERGQVAGFLFGYPLMAGNPRPYSDKIFWVVAHPRDGLPLRLTGHPLGAATPVVSS